MSVVRHMFYGSFGTQNSMVTSISKFDPSKVQCQVKLGQISSNFQNQIFLIKTCPAVQFCRSIQLEMQSFICRT